HDEAREAIGVEGKHRKKDKLVKFPQIPHRRTLAGEKLGGKDLKEAKCERSGIVRPGDMQMGTGYIQRGLICDRGSADFWNPSHQDGHEK
ncbi:unnamed protein product, partial [Thelazia callipaeda]|uniref:Polyprotein n=1 Tax=Thelazia callipaeda TaxID=103827 RepID=A0A0N5CLI6_THECL